jgi:hypothetical protein
MAHSPFQHPKADGIHKTALNTDTHHFEGVVDFDYSQVDRNLSGELEDIDRADYSLANLGSAVNVLLSWFVKGRSLEFIAGRALVLHWCLLPENFTAHVKHTPTHRTLRSNLEITFRSNVKTEGRIQLARPTISAWMLWESSLEGTYVHALTIRLMFNYATRFEI